MQEVIKSILTVAVNAPSGDNSQPWHFKARENVLRVWCEPGKDHPKFNVQNRGTYIAHGALLENIVIAAGHEGYDAKIDLFPDATDETLVAQVTFSELGAGNSGELEALYEAILKRATNRKRYDKKPLTGVELAAINRVMPEPHVALHMVTGDTVAQVGVFASKGEYVMIHNSELRSLLFSDVSWSEKEDARRKQGLFVKTLELLPPQELVFRLMNNKFIARLLVKLGMASVVAKDNASVYGTSSAFMALSIPANSKENYIAVGRFMQRLWLTATAQNLAVHPTTGTVFIHQSIVHDGAPFLSTEERNLISTSYEKLTKLFSVQNRELTMVLRIGHSGPPSARCHRKLPEIVFET